MTQGKTMWLKKDLFMAMSTALSQRCLCSAILYWSKLQHSLGVTPWRTTLLSSQVIKTSESLVIFFQIFSFCVHMTSSSLDDAFNLICFKIIFDIPMYSLLYIWLIFSCLKVHKRYFYCHNAFHTLVRELALLWYDYLKKKLIISRPFEKQMPIHWLLRSD